MVVVCAETYDGFSSENQIFYLIYTLEKVISLGFRYVKSKVKYFIKNFAPNLNHELWIFYTTIKFLIYI